MAHPARCLWLLLIPALFVRAEAPSEDDDLRILRAARVQPDGVGAVRYFRQRSSTADREEILALIRQLGDETFAVRERAVEELIARGLPAIAPLREATNTKNADIEVVRRAERCLRSIEEVPAASLSAVAARMIGRRKPEGGAEALLTFLPVADDESVADEIRDALAAVAMIDGRPNPALIQELDNKEPLRRGAAGEALLRAGEASARKLLTDPDPDVRFRATLVAVRNLKDKSAVPNLINLLADGPPNKVWRAEDVLLRLADDSAPRVSLGRDEAGRKKCRDAWAEWWAANSEKIDLAKLDHVPQMLGLTMILQTDRGNDIGRVFEVNSKNEEQWSIGDLKMPQDAVIVGADRVLIAEAGELAGRRRGGAGRVSLREFNGKEIWTKDFPNPVSVQALPRGHVFIAARNRLIELNEKQEEVFTHPRPTNDIQYAAKDRNGDYVMLTMTQIVRLKPDKTTQSISISAQGRATSLTLAPHGRVIIARHQAGLVEYDPDGKVVWSIDIPSWPMSVEKLPDGNILATSFSDRSVIEIDRHKKVVWKHKPSDQKPGGDSYPMRARRR